MTRITLAAALLVITVTAQAQNPAQQPDAKAKAKAAAVEAMMKHATPGPEHKKLEPLVGSWTFTGKMFDDPAAPPQEFQGTTERKWILDGRFMYDETKADLGGMSFQGIGYTGYDNALKKYNGLWIDNMTTSVMTSLGTMDAAGKVFTSNSESIDPATGKPYKGRDVTTIVSNDEHRMVMYRIEDGKEVKLMELAFKRKK
jgi:hypothetical protein